MSTIPAAREASTKEQVIGANTFVVTVPNLHASSTVVLSLGSYASFSRCIIILSVKFSVAISTTILMLPKPVYRVVVNNDNSRRSIAGDVAVLVLPDPCF